MSSSISVIVSTLNRPDHIVPCVRSILVNRDVDFEIVVIDQSDSEKRRQSVAAVGDDPRLRWVSSTTRGLSVSRNIGIAESRGSIIAFTDDDCRVESDWVSRIQRAFDADSELGLLFGGVVLRAEDRAKGYAAEFEPKDTRAYLHRLPDIRSPWGVGANMSIRRTVFERIGTFDPALGAGATYFAGEDVDVTIRGVAAGFKVVLTPSFSVTHLGIREGAESARLMRGYGVGLGAALAKHVRLGTPGAAGLLAGFVAHHGRRSIRNALRGSRQPGFGLVASVLWGVRRSYEKRIDRASRIYV